MTNIKIKDVGQYSPKKTCPTIFIVEESNCQNKWEKCQSTIPVQIWLILEKIELEQEHDGDVYIVWTLIPGISIQLWPLPAC